MLKPLYLFAAILAVFFLYKMNSQNSVSKVVSRNHRQAMVYSRPGCIFCVNAKNLLKSKNINYQEIDITKNIDIQQKLQKETNQFTVPYIFIDKKFIGGYQDLVKLLSNENTGYINK